MAAEVAAGAWVAEEVVSTTVQAGVGAYMVAKPTMPLKATFKQIATSQDDETRLSLARSGHSVTYNAGKAYIFGGETASGKLAGNEIHSVIVDPSDEPQPEYSVLPAVPDVQGELVPSARTKHAACKFNICVAIFGGVDEAGNIVDSDPTIWLYVTKKSAWESLKAENPSIAPVQRHGAKLFDSNNNLVLYGGVDANGNKLRDVWHFNYASKAWTPLLNAPVSTSNAALVDGKLYLITAPDRMSNEVHMLDIKDLEAAQWTTNSVPTNPMTPGPRPRDGAGLLPITTGFGRNYLLLFFGARLDPTTSEPSSPGDTEDPTQFTDLWTYQAESTQPEVKATTSFTEAIKPARIKDAIRSKLGYDTGGHSWAEVEVLPPGDLVEDEGKLHPGPRAYFASDLAGKGSKVVVWGGVNAKGEREGDGWLISFS